MFTATTGATTGGLFGSTTTQVQPTSQFSFGGATTTGGGSSFLGGGAGGINTSLTSNFGGLNAGQSTSFGLNTSQQQQQQFQVQQKAQQGLLMDPNVQQQISALSNSPYGTSYHHMKKDADIFNPVSPLAQRAFLNEAQSPTKVSSLLTAGGGDVKGGLSQTMRITPKPLSTISLNKVS